MATSFIGAAAINDASITLPAHQAGDLIVIVAFGNTTAPTLPAGWTNGGANSGGSQTSQIGYKIAASSSEVSGSWGATSGLIAHVWRGGLSARRRAYASGNDTSLPYPSLPTMLTDGTSWVALFARVLSAATNVETAPSSVTARSNYVQPGSQEFASFDTNGGVASWSGVSQTINSSASYAILSVEIESATPTVYTLTANGTSVTLAGQSASLKAARKLTANGTAITLTGSSAALRRQVLPLTANGTSISITPASATLTGPTRIAYVGSAANAGATISSMPAHQIGDLIVTTAFRNDSASAITLPSGYVSIAAGAVGSASYGRVGVKVATSSTETGGTWTGATLVQVEIYRNTKAADPIGAVANGGGAGATITYPSLTLEEASYRSWVLSVFAHTVGNHSGTPPSGSVNRSAIVSAGGSLAGNDTATGVPSFAGGAVTTGGSSGDWFATSIEILFGPPIRTLTADGTSITLAGQSATLRKTTILTANGAAVTIGGSAATLNASRTLIADGTSVTLAGDSAQLVRGWRVAADPVSITLSGESAQLLVSRRIAADSAALIVTGQAATLFKGFQYVLTANPAEIDILPDSADIRVDRLLSAEPAPVSIAGQSAMLRKTRLLTAAGATIEIVPQSATLAPTRILTADGTVITITPSAATLFRSLGPGTVIMKWYDGAEGEFVTGVLKIYTASDVWQNVTITTT